MLGSRWVRRAEVRSVRRQPMYVRESTRVPACLASEEPFGREARACDCDLRSGELCWAWACFSSMVLGLKQLPDTGEAQEFLCAQHGVGRPRFIFFFLLYFDLRFWRSEELRTFQVVKIGTNLLRGKQSPDGGDKRGQFRGELGVLLRCHHEAEQLLADQIVQRVSRPELLADVLGGGALFDPDLVEGCGRVAHERILSCKIRRTEVRPICRRRAMADLLSPERRSLRTRSACRAAVAGRPRRFPFCRAWAKPARTRSRKISRSNSANTASNPAMARPAGVVRSNASVSETKPTPRCSSSCSVLSRSVTERPQRSKRQTSTVSSSLRRAASSSFSRASRCAAPEPTSLTCITTVQP